MDKPQQPGFSIKGLNIVMLLCAQGVSEGVLPHQKLGNFVSWNRIVQFGENF